MKKAKLLRVGNGMAGVRTLMTTTDEDRALRFAEQAVARPESTRASAGTRP